jgi:energy-coupling factor transporter ATP-binding protein EcfA2
MIRLLVEHLTFSYPGSNRVLIQDFSLTAEAGEIIGIRAPNGGGKSTLLQILCGAIPQVIPGEVTGSVLIDGLNVSSTPINTLGEHVNLLLQEPVALFPDVEPELFFGMENTGISLSEAESRITTILQELGISHLRSSHTHTLSFGERKLVALTAILSLNPSVLLLDEPAAGLSDAAWNRVAIALRNRTATGMTVLLADHESRALSLAHRFADLRGCS